MAFFGVTSLGYQDPFESMLLPPAEEPRQEISSISTLPPLCLTSDKEVAPAAHGSSLETYNYQKRFCQLPKAPNQMYRQPLTTAQELGWWISRDSRQNIQTLEPWLRVPRFPSIKSEMTQYLNKILLTFPDFELF